MPPTDGLPFAPKEDPRRICRDQEFSTVQGFMLVQGFSRDKRSCPDQRFCRNQGFILDQRFLEAAFFPPSTTLAARMPVMALIFSISRSGLRLVEGRSRTRAL